MKFVEVIEKGFACLSKRPFQDTGAVDGAVSATLVEALDQGERLRFANHGTNPDLSGVAGQAKASSAPAPRLQPALLAEVVNHLDEMMLRDAKGRRDLRHGEQPVSLDPGKNQRPERVIRKSSQFHPFRRIVYLQMKCRFSVPQDRDGTRFGHDPGGWTGWGSDKVTEFFGFPLFLPFEKAPMKTDTRSSYSSKHRIRS